VPLGNLNVCAEVEMSWFIVKFVVLCVKNEIAARNYSERAVIYGTTATQSVYLLGLTDTYMN
jgi:hypothetical protein